MPRDPQEDPFRTVRLVVTALTISLVGMLLAVQVGEFDAGGVLTVPLVVVVPVLGAAVYWYVRRQ